MNQQLRSDGSSRDFSDSLLEDGMRALGLEVSSGQLEKLTLYRRLIAHWNRKVNLVSRNDVGRLVEYHFLDCAEGLSQLEGGRGCRVLDLGSGAGLPGVVWKILEPQLEMTLVDSIRKRCLFLEKVVLELELGKTEVIRSRGESLQSRPEPIGAFDVAVARTVAPLWRLVEICLPLLRSCGQLIAYKGSRVSDEIEEAKGALGKLGGEVVRVAPATSGVLRGKRTFVVVEKQTPSLDYT